MKKYFKLFGAVLAFLLCVGLFLTFNTTEVKAADIQYSGTWTAVGGGYDSVSWSIDTDGVMRIRPTNGVSGAFTPTGPSGRLVGTTVDHPNYNDVTQIIVEPGVKLIPLHSTATTSLCMSMSKLTYVDFRNLDMSEINSCASLFGGCSKLTTLLLPSNFQPVGDCSGMFSNCASLTSFDFVQSWNTSSVTNMASMFAGCTGITSLDVSNFDMSNVTSIAGMFNGCSNLATLTLFNLPSPNQVVNMSSLFKGCSKLTQLPISNWDVSSVTNMSSMFSNCKLLNNLDLSAWNSVNVTTMKEMFNHCDALTDLNVRGLDTDSCTDMEYMCAYCPFATIDVSTWNVSNVTNLSYLFYSCKNVTAFIGIENWNTTSVTTLQGTFYDCKVLETLNLSGWNVPNCTRIGSLFYNDTKLKTIIGMSDWDLSSCTWASTVFYNCISLEGIPDIVENWNTASFTTIGMMFYNCRKLEVLDLSNWDVSNVTSMNALFDSCTNLRELDVANWNTSKVTSFKDMLDDCGALEELDLSNWNTHAATDMYGMLGNTYASSVKLNLKRITLGEDFTFTGNGITGAGKKATPPTPRGDGYTGKWVREDLSYGPYTPAEFRDNYNGPAMAGVWIWEVAEVNYTINFVAPEGASGSMASVQVKASEDYELPACQFVMFGQNFDHWDDGRGGRAVYTNMATIPADTYEVNDVVTLTAVFVPKDTSVTMQDGTFEFTLKAGEKATFKGIPAGTSYQVYELTPDGWVLVQQENTSGIIQPLQESAAKFWNQYIPGITTVQFSGTKLLDNRPAEAGSFMFEIIETTDGSNGAVTIMNGDSTQDTMFPIQTSVIEGGFIQFPILVYDDDGTHTYEIREVDPNDDTIDYDTHVEHVTVVVTDDGHGNLSCEATYDDDGIHFINTSRPGSLKITKDVTNGSEANADDEFTFEIEFSNPNGMPFDQSIYWYIDGQQQPVEPSPEP